MRPLENMLIFSSKICSEFFLRSGKMFVFYFRIDSSVVCISIYFFLVLVAERVFFVINIFLKKVFWIVLIIRFHFEYTDNANSFSL